MVIICSSCKNKILQTLDDVVELSQDGVSEWIEKIRNPPMEEDK